jgi:hypothetical protein
MLIKQVACPRRENCDYGRNGGASTLSNVPADRPNPSFCTLHAGRDRRPRGGGYRHPVPPLPYPRRPHRGAPGNVYSVRVLARRARETVEHVQHRARAMAACSLRLSPGHWAVGAGSALGGEDSGPRRVVWPLPCGFGLAALRGPNESSHPPGECQEAARGDPGPLVVPVPVWHPLGRTPPLASSVPDRCAGRPRRRCPCRPAPRGGSWPGMARSEWAR